MCDFTMKIGPKSRVYDIRSKIMVGQKPQCIVVGQEYHQKPECIVLGSKLARKLECIGLGWKLGQKAECKVLE